MHTPRVAVVIVHWNRINLLEKFLPSVMASTWPNLEVVLADNASTDGSVAYVKQHFPNVTIVQLDRNYGYAGGYNHALKHVQADYYILLNNDIEVPPGWIEPLAAALQADPELGACMPKMLDYHDKALFEYAGASGGFIDHYGYPFCRGRLFDTLEHDKGQYNEPVDIFWATGACLCIRAELFHKAGGFDEHFFAHMEEIDLCWRLQLLGYRLRVIPAARVYHVGGGTLHKLNAHKTYLNFRNSLLMLYKNLEPEKLWWIVFVRHCLDVVASLQFLLKGKFAHSWAIHRAHGSFLLHLGKWNRERKKTQQLNTHRPLHGVYPHSVVWQYFGKTRKQFTQLPGL